MRICSSSWTILVTLLLSLSAVCFGKKSGFSKDDLTSFLGDLRSVESEERKSILKSLSAPEDILVGEESRKAIVIRIDPKYNSNSALDQARQANGTDTNYDLVQWYNIPSRSTEHHVEGDKIESSIDSQSKVIHNNRDLNAQGTTEYREDYENHENHDENSYEGHHQQHDLSEADGNQGPIISYHNQEVTNHHDGPTSEIFYKKMKLKKVRRNCTRSKSKKSLGWPESSDKVIQSRSHEAPGVTPIDAKLYHERSMPALPEPRFNDIPIPKLPIFPEISPRMMGFSGEHLHGIPKTHFFHYKDGDGVNHYHLHNHQHIYTPDGKKVNLNFEPSYRNLVDQFGKLKTALHSKSSAKPYYLPHLTDNYRSPLSVGSLDPIPHPGNDGREKLGYHYTGAHESYGRKTYKRTYPRIKADSMSAANDDKTIGMEMYKYGAGQYGTDEFSSTEENGRYPNEVSVTVDDSYLNSHEVFEPIHFNSHRGAPSSTEYNSDTSPRAPQESYSGETDSSYNNREKENHSYEDKAPYVPQTHIRDERTSSEVDGGYEQPDEPVNRHPYPPHHGQIDNGNGGHGFQKSGYDGPEGFSNNGHPQKPVVTHSESFSKDGAILDYDPNNPAPFRNLAVDPDPLAIPKNARVYEHHIRLHPMHYQLQSLLAARNPLTYPISFRNVNSVPYPVPLHKLMPNPLKLPIVAAAPIYTRPHFNQIIPALQPRSLYRRWW